MAEAENKALVCSCCGQPVEDVAALFDDSNHIITTAHGAHRFSNQQWDLIKTLHSSFGATLSKEQIYDRVFADATGDGPDIKIVDVVICKVRPHLKELGFVIETTWGVGYRLTAADEEMTNQVKREGVGGRLGKYHYWSKDLDVRLRDLMRRKLPLTACAQALGMPYRATERAMKRLSQQAQT